MVARQGQVGRITRSQVETSQAVLDGINEGVDIPTLRRLATEGVENARRVDARIQAVANLLKDTRDQENTERHMARIGFKPVGRSGVDWSGRRTGTDKA